LKRGIEVKAGRKWREKLGFREERRSILFFYISLLWKILFRCSFAYKYSYEDVHKINFVVGEGKEYAAT
jgi:hypothetical protein